MDALQAFRAHVAAREARLRELEAAATGLDLRLREFAPRVREDELAALVLGRAEQQQQQGDEADEGGGESVARLLAGGRFLDAVYASRAGRRLWQQQTWDSMDAFAKRLATSPDADGEQPPEQRMREMMFLGAALLQLFVQINWTGPPVDLAPDRYPLPCFPREEAEGGHGRDEHGEEVVRQRLSADAKAASAATGKDRTSQDMDPFPVLHARCYRVLEASGEPVYTGARALHYLDMARTLLQRAFDAHEHVRPATAGWWLARCATVWQESLDTRDPAEALKVMADKGFAHSLARLTGAGEEPDKDVLGLLWLEHGTSAHKFRDERRAKACFAHAISALNLHVELSGALGKRTKFQQEDKSQLILLAASDSTKAPPPPNIARGVPNTAKTESQFGATVEAGMVKVHIEEVDEDTPLHERIEFRVPEDNAQLNRMQRGHLSEIDQVAILDLCLDVKNSYAMERLTAEEMLAYCERVTENPDNWTIHGSALLVKAKLEFERYKTKERSVLQMQALVDQQTNRLTPLQYRLQDVEENAAKPRDRLAWVHALPWPPVWRLKRGLADRYRELGVMMSALDLYQELRMWEDAVACLVAIDKKHRAETLIRERLLIAPTPNLYVVLGELLQDESLLEKAWDVSEHRYARAKRLLGNHAYDRGEFAKAREHLEEALAVNAQFPYAWFRLGAAALRLREWESGKRAYARVVSLEPEDAEGWANLSTCLVQLREVLPAFQAIQQAAKFGNQNARIWDSYLTLALDAQAWDNAIEAMDTLIELEGRKAGAPRVDVRALLPLTSAVLTSAEAQNIVARFELLIGKIKAKCQSQAEVWAVLAEYYGARGNAEQRRDMLLRRCRALMRDEAWKDSFPSVGSVCRTAGVLCRDYAGDRDIHALVDGILKTLRACKWNANEAPSSEAETDARQRMAALLIAFQSMTV